MEYVSQVRHYSFWLKIISLALVVSLAATSSISYPYTPDHSKFSTHPQTNSLTRQSAAMDSSLIRAELRSRLASSDKRYALSQMLTADRLPLNAATSRAYPEQDDASYGLPRQRAELRASGQQAIGVNDGGQAHAEAERLSRRSRFLSMLLQSKGNLQSIVAGMFGLQDTGFDAGKLSEILENLERDYNHYEPVGILPLTAGDWVTIAAGALAIGGVGAYIGFTALSAALFCFWFFGVSLRIYLTKYHGSDRLIQRKLREEWNDFFERKKILLAKRSVGSKQYSLGPLDKAKDDLLIAKKEFLKRITNILIPASLRVIFLSILITLPVPQSLVFFASVVPLVIFQLAILILGKPFLHLLRQLARTDYETAVQFVRNDNGHWPQFSREQNDLIELGLKSIPMQEANYDFTHFDSIRPVSARLDLHVLNVMRGIYRSAKSRSSEILTLGAGGFALTVFIFGKFLYDAFTSLIIFVFSASTAFSVAMFFSYGFFIYSTIVDASGNPNEARLEDEASKAIEHVLYLDSKLEGKKFWSEVIRALTRHLQWNGDYERRQYVFPLTIHDAIEALRQREGLGDDLKLFLQRLDNRFPQPKFGLESNSDVEVYFDWVEGFNIDSLLMPGVPREEGQRELESAVNVEIQKLFRLHEAAIDLASQMASADERIPSGILLAQHIVDVSRLKGRFQLRAVRHEVQDSGTLQIYIQSTYLDNQKIAIATISFPQRAELRSLETSRVTDSVLQTKQFRWLWSAVLYVNGWASLLVLFAFAFFLLNFVPNGFWLNTAPIALLGLLSILENLSGVTPARIAVRIRPKFFTLKPDIQDKSERLRELKFMSQVLRLAQLPKQLRIVTQYLVHPDVDTRRLAWSIILDNVQNRNSRGLDEMLCYANCVEASKKYPEDSKFYGHEQTNIVKWFAEKNVRVGRKKKISLLEAWAIRHVQMYAGELDADIGFLANIIFNQLFNTAFRGGLPVSKGHFLPGDLRAKAVQRINQLMQRGRLKYYGGLWENALFGYLFAKDKKDKVDETLDPMIAKTLANGYSARYADATILPDNYSLLLFPKVVYQLVGNGNMTAEMLYNIFVESFLSWIDAPKKVILADDSNKRYRLSRFLAEITRLRRPGKMPKLFTLEQRKQFDAAWTRMSHSFEFPPLATAGAQARLKVWLALQIVKHGTVELEEMNRQMKLVWKQEYESARQLMGVELHTWTTLTRKNQKRSLEILDLLLFLVDVPGNRSKKMQGLPLEIVPSFEITNPKVLTDSLLEIQTLPAVSPETHLDTLSDTRELIRLLTGYDVMLGDRPESETDLEQHISVNGSMRKEVGDVFLALALFNSVQEGTDNLRGPRIEQVLETKNPSFRLRQLRGDRRWYRSEFAHASNFWVSRNPDQQKKFDEATLRAYRIVRAVVPMFQDFLWHGARAPALRSSSFDPKFPPLPGSAYVLSLPESRNAYALLHEALENEFGTVSSNESPVPAVQKVYELLRKAKEEGPDSDSAAKVKHLQELIWNVVKAYESPGILSENGSWGIVHRPVITVIPNQRAELRSNRIFELTDTSNKVAPTLDQVEMLLSPIFMGAKTIVEIGSDETVILHDWLRTEGFADDYVAISLSGRHDQSPFEGRHPQTKFLNQDVFAPQFLRNVVSQSASPAVLTSFQAVNFLHFPKNRSRQFNQINENERLGALADVLNDLPVDIQVHIHPELMNYDFEYLLYQKMHERGWQIIRLKLEELSQDVPNREKYKQSREVAWIFFRKGRKIPGLPKFLERLSAVSHEVTESSEARPRAEPFGSAPQSELRQTTSIQNDSLDEATRTLLLSLNINPELVRPGIRLDNYDTEHFDRALHEAYFKRIEEGIDEMFRTEQENISDSYRVYLLHRQFEKEFKAWFGVHEILHDIFFATLTWKQRTEFLKLLQQALREAERHEENHLFFITYYGRGIGDLFLRFDPDDEWNFNFILRQKRWFIDLSEIFARIGGHYVGLPLPMDAAMDFQDRIFDPFFDKIGLSAQSRVSSELRSEPNGFDAPPKTGGFGLRRTGPQSTVDSLQSLFKAKTTADRGPLTEDLNSRSELRTMFDSLDASEAIPEANRAEIRKAVNAIKNQPAEAVDAERFRSELRRSNVIAGSEFPAEINSKVVTVIAPELAGKTLEAAPAIVQALRGTEGIILFSNKSELRVFQSIVGALPAGVRAIDASDIEQVASELRSSGTGAILGVGLTKFDADFIRRLADLAKVPARYLPMTNIDAFFSLIGFVKRITTNIVTHVAQAIAA